ncbi:MAG: hypothetical protein ABIT38_00440, partial [Gemmatimonadaceae bacterium]
MNPRRILFPVALIAFAACGSGSSTAARPANAAAPARLEPSVEELKQDLYAFAADSFRGRETGTPDADRAA